RASTGGPVTPAAASNSSTTRSTAWWTSSRDRSSVMAVSRERCSTPSPIRRPPTLPQGQHAAPLEAPGPDFPFAGVRGSRSGPPLPTECTASRVSAFVLVVFPFLFADAEALPDHAGLVGVALGVELHALHLGRQGVAALRPPEDQSAGP